MCIPELTLNIGKKKKKMKNKTPLVQISKYNKKINKEIIEIMEDAGYEIWIENFGLWLFKLKEKQ